MYTPTIQPNNNINKLQGSIFRHLLFVLYINDLPQCSENCSINMYADVTVTSNSYESLHQTSEIAKDDLS